MNCRWLIASLVLSAATLSAQVGAISTGGLGGAAGMAAGSFGGHGNGSGAAVGVGPPARPAVVPLSRSAFGPCCGPAPGAVVSFGVGRHGRAGLWLGNRFAGRRFFGEHTRLLPFWFNWFDWAESFVADAWDSGTEAQTAPQESGLVPQPISHFEEHVPAAPLIIELQDGHWVRRRVVEGSQYGDPLRDDSDAAANASRSGQPPSTRNKE